MSGFMASLYFSITSCIINILEDMASRVWDTAYQVRFTVRIAEARRAVVAPSTRSQWPNFGQKIASK